MDKLGSWKEYLQSIRNHTHPRDAYGTFGTVRHFQIQSTGQPDLPSLQELLDGIKATSATSINAKPTAPAQSNVPDHSQPMRGTAIKPYKAKPDEMSVNSGVVAYLQIVTESGGNHQIPASWLINRKSFVMTDQMGKKVYEAETDGLLQKKNGTPAIIIETKAMFRYQSPATLRSIQMQETAEIAGWIQKYPPPQPGHGHNPTYQ